MDRSLRAKAQQQDLIGLKTLRGLHRRLVGLQLDLARERAQALLCWIQFCERARGAGNIKRQCGQWLSSGLLGWDAGVPEQQE